MVSLVCPVCLSPVSGAHAKIDARGGRVVFAQPCGHAMPEDFARMVARLLGLRLPEVSGAELIRAERKRQDTEEGYDPEQDAARADLAWMAWAILDRAMNDALGEPVPPLMWPPDREWSPGKTPIRALTIAGALIAAEIDRRLARGERP